MMECKKINALLSRYLNDELTERERYTVEKHITSCSSCTGDLRYLDAIEQSLKRVERVPMPRSVELRILARLPLLTGWEPPMYAVVAAAVFLGFVIGVWSYVINFHLLEPVIAFFRTLNADFWAWAGNNAPELLYLADYIPDLSMFHILVFAGIAGVAVYKIIETFMSAFWGHALPVPVKRPGKG